MDKLIECKVKYPKMVTVDCGDRVNGVEKEVGENNTKTPAYNEPYAESDGCFKDSKRKSREPVVIFHYSHRDVWASPQLSARTSKA